MENKIKKNNTLDFKKLKCFSQSIWLHISFGLMALYTDLEIMLHTSYYDYNTTSTKTNDIVVYLCGFTFKLCTL